MKSVGRSIEEKKDMIMTTYVPRACVAGFLAGMGKLCTITQLVGLGHAHRKS